MTLRAHVAWEREQQERGLQSTKGGRFSGLQDRLRAVSGKSSRLSAHIAAKSGTTIETRKSGPAAVNPARPAPLTAPVKSASNPASAPKPKIMEVPAHIAAKGPVHAQTYRETWAKFQGQMARIRSSDAIKGRYGSAMLLCTDGLTDAELLSRLAHAPTDRQRAADAVWTRAYAKIAEEKGINTTAAKILVAQRGISPVSAKAQTILANQRAHGGGRSDRNAKADSVWDRAYASISPEPATNPKAAKILANQRAFGGGRRSGEETER
jgi:hypothetical protein